MLFQPVPHVFTDGHSEHLAVCVSISEFERDAFFEPISFGLPHTIAVAELDPQRNTFSLRHAYRLTVPDRKRDIDRNAQRHNLPESVPVPHGDAKSKPVGVSERIGDDKWQQYSVTDAKWIAERDIDADVESVAIRVRVAIAERVFKHYADSDRDADCHALWQPKSERNGHAEHVSDGIFDSDCIADRVSNSLKQWDAITDGIRIAYR